MPAVLPGFVACANIVNIIIFEMVLYFSFANCGLLYSLYTQKMVNFMKVWGVASEDAGSKFSAFRGSPAA